MTTKTIGSASRDYSTIEAWSASIPASLAADYIGECYNDSQSGGHTFTPASQVSVGSAAPNGFNIILRCGAGQSFRDNPSIQSTALTYNSSNGVGVQCNIYGGPVFKISSSGVTIDSLQFYCNAAGPGSKCVDAGSGATGYTISNCLLDGQSGNSSLMVLEGSGAGTVFNCLLVVRRAAAYGIDFIQDSSSIYYSTAVYPSDLSANSGFGFQSSNYGTTTFIDCAAFGFGTAFGTNHTSTSCGYNASDQNTFPGTAGHNVGLLTYTGQFQNTTSASADWRVKSGSGVIGAGLAEGSITTVDIAKTARPSPPSIGVWEFVTPTPPPIFNPMRRPIRKLLIR